VLGGVLLVSGITSNGPLALVKKLPRSVHRLVDLAVMVGLVALPIAVSRGRSPLSAVLGVAVAVLLGRLVLSTRYAPSPPRRPHLAEDADRALQQGARSLGRAAGRRARRRQG